VIFQANSKIIGTKSCCSKTKFALPLKILSGFLDELNKLKFDVMSRVSSKQKPSSKRKKTPPTSEFRSSNSCTSTIDDVETWEVEAILEKKWERNKYFYLIKWKGYDDVDNSWEPEENLIDCPLIIQQHLIEAELALPSPQEKEIGNKASWIFDYMKNLAVRVLQDNLLLTLKLPKVCDGCPLPPLFDYVSNLCYHSSVVNPAINQTCICNGKDGYDCVSNECYCHMGTDQSSVVSKDGVILAAETPIFECNNACLCGSACRNRRFQKAKTIPLTLGYNYSKKKWTLSTTNAVKAGQFVMEYVGMVTMEEQFLATLRHVEDLFGKKESEKASQNVITLQCHDGQNRCCININRKSNLCRFIRQASDDEESNLNVNPMWETHRDVKMPRILLSAKFDLSAGTEFLLPS